MQVRFFRFVVKYFWNRESGKPHVYVFIEFSEPRRASGYQEWIVKRDLIILSINWNFVNCTLRCSIDETRHLLAPSQFGKALR